MHFPHADTSSHVNKFTYTHNRAHTDSKFSQHKAPQCVDWDSRLTRTKSSTVKELLQWRLWALRNREAGLTGIYGENISQFPKKKRLTSKSPPSDTNTASKQSNTGLNGCTKAWACGNNSDATPGFANSKLKWQINTHVAHYASFFSTDFILFYINLTIYQDSGCEKCTVNKPVLSSCWRKSWSLWGLNKREPTNIMQKTQ